MLAKPLNLEWDLKAYSMKKEQRLKTVILKCIMNEDGKKVIT
jgi:hypothetical protein